MSVQADMKYEATVKDAYVTESTKKGTAGLFMAYETDDGYIEHTWWITAGTAERLAENLQKCFGITQGNLRDDAFLAGIGKTLTGQMCSISTKEGEYFNGDVRVEVQWMNPNGFRPKRTDGVSLKRVAGIFGGGPVSSPAYTDRGPVPAFDQGLTDDDVPF